MTLGIIVLIVSALMMVAGSLASLFTDSHALNRRWPVVARLNCVGYGLLNVSVGFICLGMLLTARDPIAVVTAVLVLLVFDAAMVIAALLSGLEAVGDGERHIGRWPISYLSAVGHAGLVTAGAALHMAA